MTPLLRSRPTVIIMTSLEAQERLRRVGELIAAQGCDCDCDCDPDEHIDDCEVCLACRINAAITGEKA